MTKSLLILLSFFIVTGTFSQTTLDEYLNRYQKASINEKVSLFYYFFTDFNNENKDSLLYYVKDLQSIGLELHRPDIISMSNRGMSRYLRDNNLYKESERKLEKVINYNKEIGNDTLLAEAYNEMGNLQFLQGKLSVAEAFYNRSLSLAQKIKIKKYILLPYPNIARIYIEQKKYEEAEKLLIEYNMYYEEHKDPEKLSLVDGILGQLYMDLEDFDKAKDYFMLSMENGLSSGNLLNVSNGYTNLGITEYVAEEYERAESYFRLALAYRIKNKDRFFISEGYYNLGDYYFGLEKLDSALANYKRAVTVAESINNSHIQYDALNQMKEIYIQLKQDKNLIQVFEKIVLVLNEMNIYQSNKTIELLSESYEQSLQETEEMANMRESQAAKKVGAYQSIFNKWMWIGLAGLFCLFILTYVRRRKNKEHLG